MILLFGETAKSKTSSTKKTNSSKNNNPVENAGILAMGYGTSKSYLAANEYDTYLFSTPAVINFTDYAGCDSFDTASVGFMSDFSSAVATIGDCGGFSGGFSASASSFSGGASCSSSCGGFSSVG